MIEGAKGLGLSASEAELLVWQTFSGAVDLHKKNNLTCAQWIERVASRGGTTETALEQFTKGAIDKGIRLGVNAAFERAIELSKL